MASNALRDGFREVLRDPALLLIEIAWRWIFGAIAIAILALSVFLLFGGFRFSTHSLDSMSALSPIEAAQSLASTLLFFGAALLKIGTVAVLLAGICWIILNALGRTATLSRPAFAPGASQRTCFRISVARGVVTLAALVAWLLAGAITGLIAAVTSQNGIPNPILIVGLLLPALVLIATGWSIANWYLSLAPLFSEANWLDSLRGAWRLTRARRNELLEISIATAVIRLLLLIATILLSIAISALIVANPAILEGEITLKEYQGLSSSD